MSEAVRPRDPPAALRWIALEGPIGVGKTTLARRLANTYGTELILEAADDNPHLEKFYRDPARFAFQTQLHFLLQRVDQLQAFRQEDLFQPIFITDYLLDKDRLFAGLTLDHGEFELYEKIFRQIVGDTQDPDLVIYLHAPVTTLLERIARRGRAYEAPIEGDYLERLCRAYGEFFRGYERSPVLIVDTANLNFVDSNSVFAELLDEIERGVAGKSHFSGSRG